MVRHHITLLKNKNFLFQISCDCSRNFGCYTAFNFNFNFRLRFLYFHHNLPTFGRKLPDEPLHQTLIDFFSAKADNNIKLENSEVKVIVVGHELTE